MWNEKALDTKTFCCSESSVMMATAHTSLMLTSGCRGIGTAEEQSALEIEAQKKRRKKKNAAARRRAQAEEEAAAEQSLDSAEPVGGAVTDDWPAGVSWLHKPNLLCAAYVVGAHLSLKACTIFGELAMPALNVTCWLGPAMLCAPWQSCRYTLGGSYWATPCQQVA